MIQEFEHAWKNKEKKAVLKTESHYGRVRRRWGIDYKLVRGFYALLERRCTFKSNDSNSDNDGGPIIALNTTITIPILIQSSSEKPYLKNLQKGVLPSLS